MDVWQKPAQYCKAIILQLKINTFKKGKLPNCFHSSVGMCTYIKEGEIEGEKYLYQVRDSGQKEKQWHSSQNSTIKLQR